MKRFFKILLGLGILGGAIAICGLLWITRPKPLPSETVVSLTSIDFVETELKTVSFQIPSQGIVESNQRTQIAAEVPGKVIGIHEAFEVGNIVPKDTVLIELDTTDYEAAIAQAKATQADAESMLQSELARKVQARKDWTRDGNRQPFEEAPQLVQRIPQINSAQARVDSAKAAVDKAIKDKARTKITAPYEAVIASKSTEYGNYLTPGAPIAEVFEANNYEVRLPVSIDELAHLESDGNGGPKGTVSLSAFTAGEDREWSGKIIRSEGEIDRQTRSLYLIAKVGLPSTDGEVGVRPGLFVKASVDGKSYDNVAAIPFEAFTELDEVQVISTKTVTSDDPEKKSRIEHRLYPKKVNVLYRDKDFVYVDEGLSEGDKVCITEVPDLTEGHIVSLNEPENEEPSSAEDTSGDLTENSSATTKP